MWNDAKRAQALGREKKLLDGIVTALGSLDDNLRDTQDLYDLAREEDDEETLVACETEPATWRRSKIRRRDCW